VTLQNRREKPNLDRRSFRFVVNTDEELQRGETLVLRDVRNTGAGLEVVAVTEKAVREEAQKLFEV